MIFRILAKNVANINKAAVCLSRLTFCQKNVLERMNSTLADFQGKNRRISSGKCVQEISEGTNFAKSVIRTIFWPWERKFQTFPKVPSRAVITAIYVSKGWFLGKKLEVYSSLFFSNTVQNFLAFMRRIFCRIINYAFYSPKGSFWEKLVFEVWASHSRISSVNKCPFIAQNFSVGLSNLNPKWPDHPISEKNLLEYLSISLFSDCEQ